MTDRVILSEAKDLYLYRSISISLLLRTMFIF